MLCIDPHAHEAYLGLADCALGRGQTEEAIEELVAAAQDFAERGALEAAFALMAKALHIDPMRLELHIDVAELEASAGRIDMAIQRLENLAHAYEAAGQYDEAMAVIEAAEAFASMDQADDEAPEPGTTTLVTPRPEPVEEIVEIEIEPEVEHAAIELAPVPSSIEVAAPEAVPVEVAATYTVPMTVLPTVRTGDTVVGPAPGPRPRAEQSVARTASRRRQVGPALRWRPSTIQMQALTAEIPKPEQLVRSGPAVPRAVVPMRTSSIVHAPTKRRTDATIADGSRHRPREAASSKKSGDASRPAGAPTPVKVVGTKPFLVKPVETKAKPSDAKPSVVTPIVAKPKVAKPSVAKPSEVKASVAKANDAKPSAGRRKLEIRPLPGRAKPRPAPAPAPKPVVTRPAPALVEARPASEPVAARPAATPERAAAQPKRVAMASKPVVARTAPASKAKPQSSAAPRRPDPGPRKDGESLADRLRRQSTGRHHLAAKVKRIAEAEKRRLTTGFDEDATSLWCPDHLRLPEAQ